MVATTASPIAKTPLRTATPWIAAIALLTLLVPMDIRFMIGDFRLTPYRVVFLLLFPLLVSRIASGMFRWRLHDGLVVFIAFWIVLTSMIHYGFGPGLETGGIVALEVMAAYFIPRSLITTRAEWIGVLRVLFIAALVIMPIMALESLSHNILVMNGARLLMGDGWLAPSGLEANTFRLGMLRSPGTFSHPIHAGVFAASLSSLLFYGLAAGRRTMGFGITAMGAFFSLSSGAFLGLFLQIGLICYRWVTGLMNFANRWFLLMGGTTTLAFLIELASNRGIIRLFIGSFTLNPQTGYYRLLIWEYAGAEALRNPLIGIGISTEWQRPSFMHNTSVDAYWLNLALQYGLPVALGVGIAALSVWLAVAACARRVEEAERLPMLGWLMSFFTLTLIGFTVHYWHNTAAWYFYLMGMGGAIAHIMADDNTAQPERDTS